jgi:large subunit ribosomal protein L35
MDMPGRNPLPTAWCGPGNGCKAEGLTPIGGPNVQDEDEIKREKRFRLTATGKVKAGGGFKRHMLSAKASKMKRQNRGTFVLDKQDGDTVKQWLPYGLDR